MPILAKILYIASALRVRRRAIDRYIDYFGDGSFYKRTRETDRRVRGTSSRVPDRARP